MATRRRAAPRRSRRRGLSLPRIALPSVAPEIARSIVGIILLVLGVFTLVALVLPGQGNLTDWWIGSVGPWFGSLRWLLPFLLLGAGWYVEWGPGRQVASGWGLTIVGIVVAYLGLLGAIQIAPLGEISGGRLGRFFEDLLVAPLTAPGGFVLLVAITDDVERPRLEAMRHAPVHERVLLAVRHPDFGRAGRADGGGQAVPVGVVRQDQRQFDAGLLGADANAHPAGREAGDGIGKPSGPALGDF